MKVGTKTASEIMGEHSTITRVGGVDGIGGGGAKASCRRHCRGNPMKMTMT